MTHRMVLLAFAIATFWASTVTGRADLSANLTDAKAWYDTLGFPNTKDLPYVRVATGLYSQRGSEPPRNTFVEGFLLKEEADAFTVFICSVPDLKDPFEMSEPYAPLNTIRFVPKKVGPEHTRVSFEVLDFTKASAETLERVSRAMEKKPYERGVYGGRSVSNRVRIFAFGRACLQKGLIETGEALMNFAAAIPNPQIGKAEPQKIRETLQQEIGDAVLRKAEKEWGDPAISWAELLHEYEHFDTRYPASPKLGYAMESAEIVKNMTAEETAHHPKPLAEMSPAEQVAENIYQLRHFGEGYWVMWIMYEPYPIDSGTRDNKRVITPVHRLVDLGQKAVPQLIEALGDRRFTRTMEPRFNGVIPPRALRVGDVAQKILEHISGRSFYGQRKEHGKPIGETTRQRAEAWWTEIQGSGEEQVLIQTTGLGGQRGYMAARKLVAKYPETALAAIEKGLEATKEPGLRGEYVAVAGTLPGDRPLAFLREKLAAGNGLYTQVEAAQALFARGRPEALSAMIEAWRGVQPRLPGNQSDAYSEVGGVIAFLAKSGDARAINELARDFRKTPVDVRIAVVDVFLPWQKRGGGSAAGATVSSLRGMPDDVPLPAGDTSDAVERLLVSALDDSERRFGMERDFRDISCVDPRICDLAAYTLSAHWPEKYPFRWAFTSTQNDAQIAGMRNRWRSEHGLPAIPAPAAISIPAAAKAEVDPLLDKYAAAGSEAEREAATAEISKAFGPGALPEVRARLEASKDPAFRRLAVSLASQVREVQVEADAGESAGKSGIAGLKGETLDGARISKLAHDLESALPPDVRSVTVFAERTGDGTGFKVTVVWRAGAAKKQNGWDRQMAVRRGNQRLYDTNGYVSMDGIPQAEIYRGLGDALEKAIQPEIDSPVIARFRIERSP